MASLCDGRSVSICVGGALTIIVSVLRFCSFLTNRTCHIPVSFSCRPLNMVPRDTVIVVLCMS